MYEANRRSDEYFQTDQRNSLRKHGYQPGDKLTKVREFRAPEGQQKCEMCGDKVSITRCIALRNERTGQEIICGQHCFRNYRCAIE